MVQDDTHLFMQVEEKGYKAVWADKALVTEWLPASRTNYKWLWQRAYRRGNGFAFCELVQNRTLATRIQRLAKGIFRFVQGILTRRHLFWSSSGICPWNTNGIFRRGHDNR